MTVTVRAADACRYDAIALGEVMLRLDPGEGRIHTARSFQAWEGGGEYNVARGLARTFGYRTAVVTALVDNPVGRLIEGLMRQGAVDVSWVRWVADDGAGRTARNGLNFTERGFGVRGARGVSDRGHTAVSQLAPGTIDWDELLGRQGVRWLHTGGIYAALSDRSAEVAAEAMTAARNHGVVVSYDLNHRPSLWRGHGGDARAREVNRELVGLVDVLLGNEEDVTACLGIEIPGADVEAGVLPTAGFSTMLGDVVAAFPQLAVVATTLRAVHSAGSNDWGAIGWSPATGVVQATTRERLEILDRVGGGDSFASGLIHGLLQGRTLATAIEYGAAHGALAMTTPGDTSMATSSEVDTLVAGGSARVRR